MATKENEEKNSNSPMLDPKSANPAIRRRKKSSIRVPPCFDNLTDAAPPMPIPIPKFSTKKSNNIPKIDNRPQETNNDHNPKPRKNSMNSNYNSCLDKW